MIKILTASLCVKKFVFDLPVCVVRVGDGLPRKNGWKLRVNMLTSAKLKNKMAIRVPINRNRCTSLITQNLNYTE